MAKRQKVITCKLDKDFPKILDSFINLGTPIEVGLGKYSSYIFEKYTNTKYKFLTKLQTKKTFIGYVKILKDLKRDKVSVILSDLKDNVKESNNTYFDYGKAETKEYNNAVCVDLNSAYLQALFNLELITVETKNWIEKYLSKTERLVCVGMLAKRKEIITFSNKQIRTEKINENKYRFIFNAVIQEVASIMNKVSLHHTKDFIAYWVDGVYLKNEYIAFDVAQQFEKAGFPCKIEYLENFKAKVNYSHITYTYNKEDKFKILEIPIIHVHANRQREILSVINSKRIEKNLPKVTMKTIQRKKFTQGLLNLT